MIPTLAQLVSTVSSSQALATIYQVANTLGLTTTAWQPLGMARTILTTMSQVVSAASTYVNLIAQGGYASTAAQMVDSGGNPITTWMDLVSYENYGNTRTPPVQASGLVAFSNSTNVPHTFSAGSIHIKNAATGATYSNPGAAQIYGTGSPPTPFYTLIMMTADQTYLGSLGTFSSGTPSFVSAPPGCACAALGTNGSASMLVGTDAQSNAALLVADLAKLGSIAPNGAPGALTYIATQPATIAEYGTVSATITRATQYLATATGTVTVYIANAEGSPASGDVAIVQDALQALAVPTAMTLVVAAATNQTKALTSIIYVTGSTSGIATAAQAAVEEYLASVPIGGLTGSAMNEIPYSGLLAAIQAVSPNIVEQDLFPVSNVSVGTGNVVILDPLSTFTVVQVSA